MSALSSTESSINTLYTLHLATGDILRMGCKSQGADIIKRNLNSSILSYENAIKIRPLKCDAYHAIAQVYFLCNDRYSCIEYLLRGMSLEVPCDGHELLIAVFEEERCCSSRSDEGNIFCLSLQDHISSFKKLFLACAAIIYTRSSADHFNVHLDSFKKHLAMMLTFIHNGKDEESMDFLKFNKEADKKDFRSFDSSQQPQFMKEIVSIIGNEIYRSVVCAYYLFRIVSLKQKLSVEISSLVENLCMKVMSYERDIHRIKCIPGLHDSFSLLLTLVSTFLNPAIVSPTIVDAVIDPMHIVATSSALYAFLDWMKTNDMFWLGAIINWQLWSHFEHSVVSFSNRLPAKDEKDMGNSPAGYGHSSDSQQLELYTMDRHKSCTQDFNVLIFRLISCKQLVGFLKKADLRFISSNGCSIYFDCDRNPLLNPAAETATLKVLTTRTSFRQSTTQERKLRPHSPLLSLLTELSIDSSPVETFGEVTPKTETLRMRFAKHPKELSSKSDMPKAPTTSRKNMVKHSAIIVVDAANVAMRHGLNQRFSCKGIEIALHFFQAGGHSVIGFIPVS